VDLPDIGSVNRRPGANQIDSSLLAKDGRLYIGTAAGVLAQVDHRGPKVTYLGKPWAAPRMKGLIEGEDGLIYGACGAEYDTHLFTYDPGSRVFTILGPIVDSRDGTRCWLAHHMCRVDERTFIVAECDNHARASFLFKVELEK